MTLEANHAAAAATETQDWFARNRSSIVRHVVINVFNLIILLPLGWVLLMSVKSLTFGRSTSTSPTTPTSSSGSPRCR